MPINTGPINVGAINSLPAPALTPTGVASGSVGGPVTLNLQLGPAGPASASTAGPVSLLVTLAPTGVASASAGSPVLLTLTLAPGSVASASTGGPVFVQVVLAPDGIASESTAGPVDLGVAVALASYLAMSSAIRSHFDAQIGGPLSLPTLHDNAPGEQPGAGKWCRFIVMHDANEQLSFGAIPGYRKSGQAVAQVMVPMDDGVDDALSIADSICTVFRAVTVGGLRFRTPYIDIVGAVLDGAYFQVDVTCPFRLDESVALPAGMVGSSSGFLGVQNTIQSRFASLIETPLAVAVQYDGEPEEPPGNTTWIHLSVRPSGVEPLDGASQTSYRAAGVGIAMIFVPLDEGDAPALSIADSVVAAFRSVQDRGVTFFSPTVKPSQRENRWWRVNVAIPYEAIEVA